MTVIKIRDPKWFKQNCKVSAATDAFRDLIPKHKAWKNAYAFPWTSGDRAMSPLEGQVLKVQWDDGILAGDITEARYKAERYWIPNWAIEWVKEEKENDAAEITDEGTEDESQDSTSSNDSGRTVNKVE